MTFFPELNVFLLSLIPIGELRLAIPMGILQYHLNPWVVFIIAVIGNCIPVFFIVWLMPRIEQLCRKNTLLSRLLDAIFKRTRRSFNKQYERYGSIALMIFVAIPLPGTGVWTGALAGWLFGISKRHIFIYVNLGALGAGIIVLLLTMGFLQI